MSDAFLRAVGLTHDYQDGRRILRVLKGISLDVERGEVVSIVGPSGAGKSTLLHILGGLDRPTSGEVLLEGVSIYGMREGARAALRNKRFGFVFQMYHLLPEFTALENVMLPALVRAGGGQDEEDGPVSRDDARRRAGDLLGRVGLSDRAGHRPSALSGGEQQRVAIARALMNSPDVLFADEPTGNLDEESGKGVLAVLWGLNRTAGQTIVLATHDMSLAEQADRVVLIKDGRIEGVRPGKGRAPVPSGQNEQ